MPKKIVLTELFLFLVLILFIKAGLLYSFDLSLSKAMQAPNNPVFDGLMKLISQVGEPKISLSLVIFISSVFFVIKKRKHAYSILILAFGLTGVVEGLKLIVHRGRPNPLLGIDSFPSFHVAAFMAIFGYLFLISKNKLLKTAFVLLIILMGVSRIYLREHWPSDVLGSVILGTLGLGVIHTFNKRN